MTTVPHHHKNDLDAHVVQDICGYITAIPPSSFFLFAGAGSGKTRTLIEVLRRITGVVKDEAGGRYGEQLRSRGQSVRVITYTKNAAGVVTSRLGENLLTTVSTIHSFCWELIKGFDEDIRDAQLARSALELEEAKAYARGKKGASRTRTGTSTSKLKLRPMRSGTRKRFSTTRTGTPTGTARYRTPMSLK
ncbi:UvrD-helicase domain-containing protein [Pseudomonas sp. CCC4.1]|uniref:UvrD-helicase domain-containing protein n=1 Tax=Pseudomonas sp. CCC4.1 TaxID=3048610 RepID=UPI002AB41EC6|nr:UvrD-helicase domain-containing protein [Pseudomonas sp. CCC4.1]MDY7571255.1 AAA family ATPase [Pseudomonas sp. CCC4.1]